MPLFKLKSAVLARLEAFDPNWMDTPLGTAISPNNPLTFFLSQAIESSDVVAFKALIEHGASLNAVDHKTGQRLMASLFAKGNFKMMDAYREGRDEAWKAIPSLDYIKSLHTMGYLQKSELDRAAEVLAQLFLASVGDSATAIILLNHLVDRGATLRPELFHERGGKVLYDNVGFKIAMQYEVDRHITPVPTSPAPAPPETRSWAANVPKPRKDLEPLQGKGDMAVQYMAGTLPEQQRIAYAEEVTILLEGIARHYGVGIQNPKVSEQNLNVMSFTMASPEQAVSLTQVLQAKGLQVVNVHNGFVLGWDAGKAAGSLQQKLKEIVAEIGATPVRSSGRRGSSGASLAP